MNIKNKLQRIETARRVNQSDWIKNATDAELKSLVEAQGGGDPHFTEWLKTLSDKELLTLRDGKPGARKLLEKFNEYQASA